MTRISFSLLLAAFLGMGLLQISTAQAGIGQGHHVNVVSFQKDDEVQGAANYPATFTGSFSALIASMEGKADPLMMVHTPHIHSGDVINVQIDVLGESDQGLENDGLNCALSYNENSGGFSIAGMCTILTATEDVRAAKHRVIIPSKAVPISPHNSNGKWILIFFDAKTEVAFYANIEE
ncbi:MAG: hypothetical protein ACE5E3_01110 [Mariprofundus sp.]